MTSPSGPEDGDLDPTPTLLHRKEMDAQERLDLEEEKRERELSQSESSGTALKAPMTTGAAVQTGVLDEEGCRLEAYC